MKPGTLIALLLLLAAHLQAQGGPPGQVPSAQGSPGRESFQLEPSGVATGAQGAYLRLLSNSAAGFASSSSKQPEVSFGEGVTLVTGSFRLLNTNEAECRVNVEADAFGTVEVKLVFYSVNGTSVLSTQRATLGLLGPTKTAGIDVSVESVALVRVNVSETQAAGVVVLSGGVNGLVTLVAPTGCRFARQPVAVTSKGNINTPSLAEGNTQFNFGVGNAAGESTVVRITEIAYDTSSFTLTGGTTGTLNCELRGPAIGGQSVLVANAYTALTTIAGTNDNTDVQPTPTGSQGSGSTNTPSGTPVTTTVPGNSSSSGTGRARDTERPARTNTGRTQPAPSRATPASGTDMGGTGRSSAQPNPPIRGEVAPGPGVRNEPPAGPAPARAVPAGGTGATAGGDGGASWVKDSGKERSSTAGEPPAPKLVMITTPGLYFCDKDFQPLDMVVLSSLVSDRAGARVWILVKLEKDKNPDAVETIDVTLRVSGTVRQLKLTETGKNSGEFRCDKAGVLLVSNEDPDSNATEKPASEPRARTSGLGR